MKRYIYIIGIILLTGWLASPMTSCQRTTSSDDDVLSLRFSSDTLLFDTVFTTMGSTTRQVRVYNPTSHDVRLNTVSLRGGSDSRFRLNVDGDTARVARDVVIAAHDSIFIFAQVTINPNAATTPFLVDDAIVFTTSTAQQELPVVAFGRNAVYHVPDQVTYDAYGNAYPYSIIDCEEWNHTLPHVVMGYALVYAGSTLSLQAGEALYFDRDATLWVYDDATLSVHGTYEQPVRFTSIRHDGYYDYLAGQWGYLWLSAGSKNNVIDWAVIENGTYGLVVDTNVNDSPTLTITNSHVANHDMAGIVGQGAWIVGDNLLVDNCGLATVVFQLGGRYALNNSTLADYWSIRGSSRSNAHVILNNWYLDANNALQLRTLEQCDFNNCLIYGNLNSDDGEIFFNLEEGAVANINFDHCLIKSTVATNYATLTATLTDKDPLFVDADNRDYRLGSESPALGAGSSSHVTIPYDLNRQPRQDPPAIGCYEWVDTTATTTPRPCITMASPAQIIKNIKRITVAAPLHQ